MTEKGIVLEIFQGRACVQLERASGVSPDIAQTPLMVRCPHPVKVGTPVVVLLSPPHPIHMKPMILLTSILISILAIIYHIFIPGFLLSLLMLFVPFFKLRKDPVTFEPIILSKREEPQGIRKTL